MGAAQYIQEIGTDLGLLAQIAEHGVSPELALELASEGVSEAEFVDFAVDAIAADLLALVCGGVG